MAKEGVVLAVKDEGDLAVWAFEGLAAVPAVGEGGVAAPIQKEEDLVAVLQRGGRGLEERLGYERPLRAPFAVLEVDQFDGGERGTAEAAVESEEGVLLAKCPVVALYARCRRAEDYGGAPEASAGEGKIAGMVGGGVFLLVR